MGQPCRDKRKKPAAAYFPAGSSIIGARGLDFRVRNGNGYCPSAMAAGNLFKSMWPETSVRRSRLSQESLGKSVRPFGHGNDNMAKPHGLLVPLG